MAARGLIEDLIFGARSLARRPGFTLVAVSVLAVGAGATTAMYSVVDARALLVVMTIFGSVALLLAVVGLYGVLAFAVRQRTKEIGIRIAPGQAPTDIRGLVLFQGLRLTVGASVLGLAVSAMLSRLAAPLLFGVAPVDLRTYTAVTVVIACAALLACWIPARRATRMDPIIALRQQ